MEWKVDLEDEKEDSEKDDISDDQPKSILIPEANTNVIRDQGENPEDSQKENLMSLKRNIDKTYKGRFAMIYFNDSFLSCVSNDSIQSVAEHMVKFKGRSSMRQYANKKAIK